MSGGTPLEEDIVGDRVLVGLQSVRISRLSTHPVPVAVGTLIAVAGQGPKDSNGAGKSSLIAQISLLHADEQWRFGSGAHTAVDLLFNAEDAGGEDRWGNADHGYVIGVFAPAAAMTLQQLQTSALTVWIRIDRSSQKGPRLKLRWQDGLHLPTGNSEAEREQAADSLWQALPPRAGRQDVAARDLPRTLYGEHVRCVSFLSTSVRASITTNLLAQPLNEISERRIFEAIAALTGIDRELEKERQARRYEYDRQQEASDAASELASWEASAQVIEDGIDARDRARRRVVKAAAAWQSRTARLLCDALQRDTDIRAKISEIDTAIERDSRTAQELAAQAAQLADDKAFTQRQQTAISTFGRLEDDDRELGKQIATLELQIEDVGRLLRAARETARDADGRDAPTADQERANADSALEEAIKAAGVTEHKLAAARKRLQDTESGRDLARQQIDLLEIGGIDAIGLLDAIILNDEQRPRWEPTLWPYREAAVVDSNKLDNASVLLADLPGSILIAANLPASAPPDSLPGNASPHYDLSGFLAALDARSAARDEPDRIHDDAGIVIVGGFPEPVTGRAVRIAAAWDHVLRESDSHHQAEERLKAAKQQVTAAERRQKGVRAAAEAARLDERIGILRKENQAARDEHVKLTPMLIAARSERDEVLRLDGVRQQTIESLQHRKTALDEKNKSRREDRESFEEERSQLGLPELAIQWNGTADSAREHLLGLPEHQQFWTADDWWEDARSQIADVLSECFPPTATASMPMEIAVQRDEFSQRGPGRVRKAQETFPQLHHALHVYLRHQEDTDKYERQQIAIQREERHKSLEVARIGHEEAVQASRAYRGALTSAIKKKLTNVAAEFDRLDMDYGGYGALLQYDEPPPPADPTEAWDWKVTPMWRRAEGRRLIPYNRRANTAQIDDRAIKLVCAAAAASGTGRPLVLVLDELGRNLGKQHRREAVALLGQIGRDNAITVFGALQDDMESYAIDACGQYVKLRRSSDSSPYNEQPVVVGYDEHAPRVELLRAWLTGNEYREPA
ncbi:chromosome partitioning protein ParA [Nonomuraea wenchangensis]